MAGDGIPKFGVLNNDIEGRSYIMNETYSLNALQIREMIHDENNEDVAE